MPALKVLALAFVLACAPKQPPEVPSADPKSEAPAKARKVSGVGAVETRDGTVSLTGMIVPTRTRAERTVEALGIGIVARAGSGWFVLRVTTEVSDDGGLDYIHCHELELRASSAPAMKVTTLHRIESGKEGVDASLSIEMLRKLGEADDAGGRLCDDDFTLDAAQKAKLLEFVEAMGPVVTATEPTALGLESPFGTIGIATCDEYIGKYYRCIEQKVPEAAREQMKEALRMTVDAWREAANGPARDQLDVACKAALDAAKQATASMGCEW